MIELREAAIIVPVCDNEGFSLAGIHGELQRALIGTFGGYTCLSGVGGWKRVTGEIQTEKVFVYVVAVEETLKVRQDLEYIAKAFRRIAGQQAVYVRYAQGDVVLV